MIARTGTMQARRNRLEADTSNGPAATTAEAWDNRKGLA
jgi:hypothetical protein